MNEGVPFTQYERSMKQQVMDEFGLDEKRCTLKQAQEAGDSHGQYASRICTICVDNNPLYHIKYITLGGKVHYDAQNGIQPKIDCDIKTFNTLIQ